MLRSQIRTALPTTITMSTSTRKILTVLMNCQISKKKMTLRTFSMIVGSMQIALVTFATVFKTINFYQTCIDIKSKLNLNS